MQKQLQKNKILKRIGVNLLVEQSPEHIRNKVTTKLADPPVTVVKLVPQYDSDSDRLTPRRLERFEKCMGKAMKKRVTNKRI